MLYTKFLDNRTLSSGEERGFLKVFAIYEHGDILVM